MKHKVYEFEKGGHSVFCLNYHFVQCIKYRKNALVNSALIDELKQKTKTLAESYNINIDAMETDKNHIHILLSCKPTTNITKFINNWKSSTAKYLKNKYPELKKILWGDKFWSPSYCLITTGQVTLDSIKKYVENQGE